MEPSSGAGFLVLTPRIRGDRSADTKPRDANVRQLLFIMVYLTLLPCIFVSPFIGIIVYKWLEYMPPSVVYYANALPNQYSLFVALITIGVWTFTEKKVVPRPFWLLAIFLCFVLWTQITTYLAVFPEDAAVKWERTNKVFLIALLTSAMLTTRVRIEALMWTMALAIGYFAISGAAKTILSGGGGNTVVGAYDSFMSDRVAFAFYLCALIPILWYLGRHDTMLARFKWRNYIIKGLIVAVIISVIGTHARTGIVAGLCTFAMFVWHSKHKFVTAVGGVVMLSIALMFAPAEYFKRAETVETYDQDESAQSRVESWTWAYNYAKGHPIVGGGYKVFQLNLRGNSWLEAHNSFFEVLAEHGFVGLFLFISVLAGIWFNCGWVINRCRQHPDLAWAADLGRALRIALVAYASGGFFGSCATFNLPYDILALSIGLRGVVLRELAGLVATVPGPVDMPRRGPLWPAPAKA
ncbi:MAG: O-antigen ligase [Rhodospirillales bacterium]|nr:O-antigen ligase [Rhodospirillales bacterium]